MALDKVKQGVIADDAVGSAQISPNALADVDIAPDSIGTSELKNDAVETANIKDSTGASDGITTAKLASNAVTTAKITDANITAGKLHADITAGKVVTTEVKPHIIPGVLYPAIGGKGIDGSTTVTSFGTDFAISGFPTLKYYYTDIKGSKPINDPRIGAYFGSQRHTLDSIQLLEQETATHGKNVYSVDGREWMRVVGADSSHSNNSYGNFINGYEFIEVVGYFNSINIGALTESGRNPVTFYIDGSANGSETDFFEASVILPTGTRFVDSAGYQSVPLTAITTPGIHTFKMVGNPKLNSHQYGIELIAQDTTSTANRSKIQIPSQNVVSYGKKFNVSGTSHYDPFSAKTDGSAWTSPTSGTNNANSAASWPTNIDTANSLGLDKWVDGSSYYRPYNGGRVVKYVDSTGTIKTAVTMMPPNAKSIKSADVNKKAKNAGNTTYLPTFEDETTDVNEDLLHEVAKTFNPFEFGNGAANGGTASGSWPDASMLSSTADDVAYVMDDGLSSFTGNDVKSNGADIRVPTDGSYWYYTFIGTGISLSNNVYNFAGSGDNWTIEIDGVSILASTTSGSVAVNSTFAQNLPYGTHILRIKRTDGEGAFHHSEITFHQPKKPPIPEDACVIADYMLMADYVEQTGDPEGGQISKGVRSVCGGRDVHVDASASLHANATSHADDYGPWGITNFSSSTSTSTNYATLPYFGTAVNTRGQGTDTGWAIAIKTDNTGSFSNKTTTHRNNGTAENRDILTMSESDASALGSHSVRADVRDGGYRFIGFDIATPIHTSSHYQTFETPFLHELVGSDRNMEQTNLVVSTDGKTWDEVTRDTSYIGNQTLSLSRDGDNITSGNTYIFDYTRGTTGNRTYFNKDWAIAYDRVICLKDGQYSVDFTIMSAGDADRITITVLYNGSNTLFGAKSSQSSGEKTQASNQMTKYFKRGDTLYLSVAGNTTYGTSADGINAAKLEINRV